MTPTGAPVLTVRALNRALLERQLLLRRAALPALDAVEHLVGLQAQSPMDPYYALAARLDGFDPEELSGLLASRAAVRIAVMRSTLHLVGARDCLTLRALCQPVQERSFRGNQGKRLTGVDLSRVAALARDLVAERPYTFHELGQALAREWPGSAPQDLAMAARALLPLVQVPPRGLWGRGGPAAHTTTAAWLGQEPDPRPDAGAVLRRYLAAFGPASVKDMQKWCGLTGLRTVVDGIRPGLRTFRDENGTELFDLPDAPLPDPDTDAPVRFLPEFDNIALSYADRARVVDPASWRRVRRVNRAAPTVVLDGFIRGVWRLDRAPGTTTLTVEPFERIRAADRAALEDEAARLLAMAAQDTAHDVRVVPAAAA
ncbi:winged helix DNA-binding domain-containing protein [Streptomyces sp. ISL-11]|uniref:winged helix DNA-binding domain-containing protein n=1 Tax=Streptomyces sp. ISL-11 TaxID=2819174 RepID=UPI001BE7DE2D|nr:winged helix DNA-binding domain-containing protein [Streptomyces sp. ISL-11]MBT2385138.1 AlkZ family DNA glycosylase [Streptomyces sp. ISL-11]